jgi:hypothetical protein
MDKNKSVVEVIIFKGIKFRRYPNSKNSSNRNYFYCGSQNYKKDIRSLHREIWKDKYGQIPKGFDVHHEDANTLNNNISNLKLISNKDHSSYHAKKKYKEHPEIYDKAIAKAQIFAKEWHKSDEGKKWHSKHAKEVYKEREYKIFGCIQCKKEFRSRNLTGGKFCSDKCKARYRRYNKLDNETRECKQCNSCFGTNKYSKTLYCSRTCSAKAQWEERKKTKNL